MNQTLKYIFFLFILLISTAGAFSQDKLITVSYDQSPMEDVAKDMEAKSDFHFYFDPAQFDSFLVSIHLVDKSVPYILKQIFQGTFSCKTL